MILNCISPRRCVSVFNGILWPLRMDKILLFVDAVRTASYYVIPCKVTKESSGANEITRNAIDFTSITLRWTLSSSQQSVFSTTSDGSQRSPNGGESPRSVYLVKINWVKIDVRTFARIKKVNWDQLLATKAEIIQS